MFRYGLQSGEGADILVTHERGNMPEPR